MQEPVIFLELNCFQIKFYKTAVICMDQVLCFTLVLA